jgi:hypothetical protein
MVRRFSDLETRYSDCHTTGFVSAVASSVDAVVGDLDDALSVGLPNGCQSAKLRAGGAMAKCLLKLVAREIATQLPVDPFKVQRCHDRLLASFAKAEAGGQSCATAGDADAIETLVDNGVADIEHTLTPDPPPP